MPMTKNPKLILTRGETHKLGEIIGWVSCCIYLLNLQPVYHYLQLALSSIALEKKILFFCISFDF